MKLLEELTCFPDSIRKPNYYPGPVEIHGKDKLINGKITLKNMFNNYIITSDNFSIAIIMKEKEVRIKQDKITMKRRYEEFHFDEDLLINFLFQDKFDLSDLESYFNLRLIPIDDPKLEYDSLYQVHVGAYLLNKEVQVGYIILLPVIVGMIYRYKLNVELTILLSEVTEVTIEYVKDNSRFIETRSYQSIEEFPVSTLLNLKSDFFFEDVESLLNLKS